MKTYEQYYNDFTRLNRKAHNIFKIMQAYPSTLEPTKRELFRKLLYFYYIPFRDEYHSFVLYENEPEIIGHNNINFETSHITVLREWFVVDRPDKLIKKFLDEKLEEAIIKDEQNNKDIADRKAKVERAEYERLKKIYEHN